MDTKNKIEEIKNEYTKSLVKKRETRRIELYKKIVNIFSKYPEPYKTQALANFKLKNLNLSKSYNSNRDILFNSFNWHLTKEEYYYWYKFYNSLI